MDEQIRLQETTGQEEKTRSEESANGATVAERRNSLLSGAQKLAADLIDASEEYGNKVLAIQARAANWTKGTPLRPVVEMQHALARRTMDLSARAARALWRLEQPPEKAA